MTDRPYLRSGLTRLTRRHPRRRPQPDGARPFSGSRTYLGGAIPSSTWPRSTTVASAYPCALGPRPGRRRLKPTAAVPSPVSVAFAIALSLPISPTKSVLSAIYQRFARRSSRHFSLHRMVRPSSGPPFPPPHSAAAAPGIYQPADGRCARRLSRPGQLGRHGRLTDGHRDADFRAFLARGKTMESICVARYIEHRKRGEIRSETRRRLHLGPRLPRRLPSRPPGRRHRELGRNPPPPPASPSAFSRWSRMSHRPCSTTICGHKRRPDERCPPYSRPVPTPVVLAERHHGDSPRELPPGTWPTPSNLNDTANSARARRLQKPKTSATQSETLSAGELGDLRNLSWRSSSSESSPSSSRSSRAQGDSAPLHPGRQSRPTHVWPSAPTVKPGQPESRRRGAEYPAGSHRPVPHRH